MASIFRSLSQPADALVRVPYLPVIGEEQLPQGILGLRQALSCRPGEPVLCLLTVRNQQRAVPVELPQQELRVGITLFRQVFQFFCRLVPI